MSNAQNLAGLIAPITAGTGITLTGTWPNLTINSSGGGSGSAITVKDENTSLTTALNSINFAGTGVTATTSGNDVTVTIPGDYTLTGTTTNTATETEIFVNGTANSRIAVATNKAVSYSADIIGRSSDNTTVAAFHLKGIVLNAAGTVSDVGSIYEIIVGRTSSTILVDMRSDNTNKTLNVWVTGLAGKTISWKCVLNVVEV